MKTAIEILKYRPAALREVQEIIAELAGFQQDITQLLETVIDGPQHNRPSEEGKTNIYESKIDPDGDIILDFASGDVNYSRLQFQVSSHMLSKASPLFALALRISPSRTPYPNNPHGMEGQLPVVPATATASRLRATDHEAQQPHDEGDERDPPQQVQGESRAEQDKYDDECHYQDRH